MTAPRWGAPPALVRLAAGVLLVVAALLAAASPASAHAVLVDSTPADGARVERSPDRVVLEFSEAVSVDLGGVDVLDSRGDPVGVSDPVVADATITVGLPPDLPEDTYVTSWRVISADGHTVSGAIVFGVRVDPDEGVADAAEVDDPGWEVAAGIGRFLGYAGALLAAGGAFFAAWILVGGVDRRGITMAVLIGQAATLLALPVLVASQAALASGDGWEAATDLDTVEGALASGLGWQVGLLLAAVVLAGTVLLGSATAARVGSVGALLAVGIGLTAWGHTRAATPVALAHAADVVHVVAAAVWVGGLVGLAILLARAAGPAPPVAETVRRFSSWAIAVVVALVVAGGVLTWLLIDSPADLVDSDWGLALLVKVGLVAVVVGLAAYNRRRLVPALGEADDRLWVRLRRTVAAEAVVLALVVAVTAVLVDWNPPGAVTAGAIAGGSFSEQQPFGEGTLSLDLLPGVAGRNEAHLYYFGPEGALADAAEAVTLELTLAEEELGPISVPATRLTDGHFTWSGTDLSLPGEWEVTVVSRTSRFTEERTTFTVPIAPAGG